MVHGKSKDDLLATSLGTRGVGVNTDGLASKVVHQLAGFEGQGRGTHDGRRHIKLKKSLIKENLNQNGATGAPRGAEGSIAPTVFDRQWALPWGMESHDGGFKGAKPPD